MQRTVIKWWSSNDIDRVGDGISGFASQTRTFLLARVLFSRVVRSISSISKMIFFFWFLGSLSSVTRILPSQILSEVKKVFSLKILKITLGVYS